MACHLPDEGEQQRREGIDFWFLRLLGAHLPLVVVLWNGLVQYPSFSACTTRSWREYNKRLNASDSAALRRAFAVRLDCLNADLERGWIVLMVARSNRQRSDPAAKKVKHPFF